MMIRINNLAYDYPDGTRALRNINIEIAENDSVALIGKNGAGKTTLLLHLNGILQAKSGKIIIENQELKNESLKEIRKKVGIVFQNPDDMLFSPTVYEDVAFGPKNMGLSEHEIERAVDVALRDTGMLGFESKNPHHLSLGQKKRVSIASILSMRPKIIIFDEPTSHLDPKGRREILDLIDSLKCTKIISTHDMQILNRLNKIHIIDNGTIVYSGKLPEEEILMKYNLI